MCAVCCGYLWAKRRRAREVSAKHEIEREKEKIEEYAGYMFAAIFWGELTRKLSEWLNWHQHYDWCVLKGHANDVLSPFCTDYDPSEGNVHWGWWQDLFAPWIIHVVKDLAISAVAGAIVLLYLRSKPTSPKLEPAD